MTRALLIPLIAALLAPLAACQTPAQPRSWHDEFTDQSGQYIYASRASGGYNMRLISHDDQPAQIQMTVRSTRRSIRGETAYLLIDGEPVELAMRVARDVRERPGARPHFGTGVGVGRGWGTSVSTGVGIGLGGRVYEAVHVATVTLDAELIERMLAGQSVRFRAGEASGPTYDLSELTRQRMAYLLDQQPAQQ